MSTRIDEAALRTRLLSGARWAIAMRILAQALNWTVTLVMVRLLSPRDYGLNSMIEVPVELFALFCTLGIDSALVRFGNQDARRLSAAFGFLLIVNLIIFLLLMALAPSIATYFGEPTLEPLLRVASIVFLITPFRTIPNALLDINLEFKVKAQVEFQSAVITAPVALSLAYLGAGVWALIAMSLSNAAVRALLLAWRRPWFIVPSLDISSVRPLITYGWTVLLGSILFLLGGKVYSWLGGPSLGADALGLFSIAAAFSYMPISKVMPIVQQTLFPAFARLANDAELLKLYILRALEVCTLVIAPICLGLAFLAQDVSSLVFGDRWSGVAAPLALLSALTPLNLITLIMHPPLNATGRASTVAKLSVANSIVPIVGIWLARGQGIHGLVLVAMVSTSSGALVSALVARHCFGIQFRQFGQALGPPTFACVVMGISIYGFRSLPGLNDGWLLFGMSIAVGSIAYLLTLHLLMGSRLRELLKVGLGR